MGNIYYPSTHSQTYQNYYSDSRKQPAKKINGGNNRKKKTNHIVRKIVTFVFAMAIICAIVIGGFVIFNALWVAEHPISLEEINSKVTKIIDVKGKEYSTLGTSKSEDYPDVLKNAVIAIEDKRFYTHEGVDLVRTTKAILDTVTSGRFGAGGSTITQQLVKNVTGDDTISISRKVREWCYAVSLEGKTSKDTILVSYLNKIYFGNGNFGASHAINSFWGKQPEDITLAESAFLAGVIRSPETYVNDLDRANERKNLVLKYMLEQDMISKKDYDKATSKYITIQKGSISSEIYSWYTEAIMDRLENLLKEKGYTEAEAKSKMKNGGYTIYSTVNPSVQSMIEKKYANMKGDLGKVQSAMVVMDTKGKVTAIVGGTGKKTENLIWNRAFYARRQPGSSIKPLAVYAPAFETGTIDSMSIYEDKEITYNGDWTPVNYDHTYGGSMTIREAIRISNNTIPIQILNQMGTSTGISFLKQMGFKTNPNDNALTLGVGAVDTGYTPLEMASGYQTLANGGVWCEPILFTKIVDSYGNTFYDSEVSQKTKRVFSEETSAIITNMLQTVVNGGGTGRYLKTDGIAIAAKTGTTTTSKDKWLCAYTPNYVVTSWFGYDTPKAIDVSSSYIQGITRNVITNLNNGSSFDIPNTLSYITVCKDSGMIANEYCENTRQELVLRTSIDVLMPCTICQGTIFEEAGDAIEEGVQNVWDWLFGEQNNSENVETTSELQSEIYVNEEETEYIEAEEEIIEETTENEQEEIIY